MKKENRLLEFTRTGILMLLLSCAALGADAAMVVQAQEFSFRPRVSITDGSMGRSVPKFIPWSMACISVCGAMLIRRRSH